MENFKLYNPVNILFGKNVINKLGETVLLYGKKVLLVYGKGSVKKNGIYDSVINQLKSINAEVYEYCGIKSNPVVDDVNKAAKMARENNIDVILAVGGGSVIDSAKIISLCIKEKLEAWDVMKYKVRPTSAVPVITVLTLAATGSEMNEFAVLQNHITNEKIGYGSSLIYPKHSFLDPQYTFSVNKEYTAYGIVDLIAHALEAYFGYGDSPLIDRFIFEIIKEAMEVAPLVLDEPNNYDYRARVMLAATCALNGMTIYGKTSGDWGTHDIGHNLSLLYDIPHGASLSIAYPAWLKLHKERASDKILKLGKTLFKCDTADETIKGLEDFFVSINSPVKLQQAGISADKKNEIEALMKENEINGYNYILSEEDYSKIAELIFE